MSDIEDNIKRCKKLTEPQNANWIGISNQMAIAGVLEKIKELEAKLEFKKWGDLDNIQFEEYMNNFIPKQKLKNKIEELKQKAISYGHLIDKDEAFKIECEINVLEELLEEK